MDENKAWAIYSSLLAILKQLDSTRELQLYANVNAAVSSARGLLVQELNPDGE